MKTLTRWIVMVAGIVALTLSAAAQTTWAVPGANGALHNVHIRHVDRTVLGEDVVHYRFEVVVGPGKFDRIRLHRVVREKHPWQPIHTATGVLLLPGGPNSFEMIFLEPAISKVPRWDHSIAVFLAKNKIDVWGIDYGWALVPQKQKNFQFMKGWGIEKDALHAEIALSMARSIRGMTGQGSGRMHLLGFSWGATVAYTLAGDETQMPRSRRNMKGLIPVDLAFKLDRTDDIANAYRLTYCDAAASYKAQLDAGVYNDGFGAFIKQIADLARSAPDDPSPFADGLSNYQFALFVGASGAPPISWHFVAGYFDESGIPTGLRFSDPWLWVDVLRAIPPYLPYQAEFDLYAATCDDIEVGIDDHLSEITLPILYVASAGGDGTYGYYTLTLTQSTDITKFNVQQLQDDQRALDFGHADLFTAQNAETLVWQPILDWLAAHR